MNGQGSPNGFATLDPRILPLHFSTEPDKSFLRLTKDVLVCDADRGRRDGVTHTPRRTCVGCRRTADVTALVRVGRSPDGTLHMGPGPGRGAWLCAPPAATDCLDAAMRRRALERALRATVGGDEVAGLRARLGK